MCNFCVVFCLVLLCVLCACVLKCFCVLCFVFVGECWFVLYVYFHMLGVFVLCVLVCVLVGVGVGVDVRVFGCFDLCVCVLRAFFLLPRTRDSSAVSQRNQHHVSLSLVGRCYVAL